uniref:Galectin n=1 Tax=Tetraodon nigroviridis TaxID=99883 RepID=H3DJC7_TETNG
MPYKHGAPFETIILAQGDAFKVAVNGAHLLEYKHKIPLNRVDTLSVSGGVSVHAIAYIPNSVATSLLCSFLKYTTVQYSHVVAPPIRWNALPYKGSILKGLIPGQHITIKGQVSTYPHSLPSASQSTCADGTENVALHLNPRIKSGVFIRNSYLGGSWGQEERELPFFPFSSGGYFEILLLCQPHQFKLAVNGCHLFEFRHRVQDLSSIDQLEIMGDLELADVKLW